jgi:hypothetical protein
MVGAHLSRTPRRQLAAFPVERLGGRCDNVDYGLGHASSDGEEGSGRRADGKGEELCWGFLQNYAMPCTPCYSKRPWTCISSKQASRKVKQANATASASTFLPLNDHEHFFSPIALLDAYIPCSPGCTHAPNPPTATTSPLSSPLRLQRHPKRTRSTLSAPAIRLGTISSRRI